MSAADLTNYGLIGYGLIALTFLVRLALIAFIVGAVVWVVLCLITPWADRTVAKHIEAADAAEYPELDERQER